MNILNIKDIEDCFDGSFIKEVTFDCKVDKTFVDYLSQSGTLEYHPDFLIPFYKITCEDKFILEGGIGNITARLILYRDSIEESKEFFNRQVTAYNK